MKNFLPIALIVASVGIFMVYINPTYTADTGAVDNAGKSIKELQVVEKDYTDAFAKTREIRAIYDGLLNKFNTVSGTSNDEKIAKLLPDHIDSVRLIIDLNNIAFRYGMSLSNIFLTLPVSASKSSATSGQVAPTQTSSGVPASVGPDYRLYDSIKLSFSVTGTYSNFSAFLKDLESSLRLIDVTSLTFSSGKFAQPGSVAPSSGVGSAGSDVYTYTMTVKTYYLK
jgi:hypothetical protein